ncbi:hypothetical protein [Mycobacterium sp. SMC-11]|uniref:DUF7172 family protein n=1 Tax=Mycobacterium sp. SMC-11 TaxID=3385969 RepID=UPI00390C8A4F
MIRPCTSEFLLSTADGLGLSDTWFPRVVAEAFLKSTKDGEIKYASDAVTMIDGDLTWYNQTPDRQAIVVQVIRAPRSVVSQSPSTVVIHDAWSFDVGKSPSAIQPTVVQDSFGGKCQIDRDSVAASDLIYGRVFYDQDATQSWVNIGLVEPGESLHFRYLAAVQTPGVWTEANNDKFVSRWEAKARYTRLVAYAMPWSITDNALPNHPTSIDVKHPAGVYSYFAPDSLGPGNALDVVVLGAGGGGEGDRWDTTAAGGLATTWNAQTLVFGTDFDESTRFDIIVGKGGRGGEYNTAGGDGGPTSVAWTDPSGTLRKLSSAGGRGGDATNGDIAPTNPKWGQSPGNKLFNSRIYPGGSTVQPAIFQKPGSAPGGGGPAGNFLQYGMPGADGIAIFNTSPTSAPQEIQEHKFTTPGTYDIPVPAWASKADLVGVGSGAGGGGGTAGTIDVPESDRGSTLSAAPTWFWVDGVTELIAEGGTGAPGGGVELGSTAYKGQGSGDFTFNDIHYAGSVDVNAKQRGSWPGGGGGGAEFGGFFGFGGGAGQWNGKTINVTPGSVIRVTVGDGGLPNGYNADLDRGIWFCQQGAPGAAWVRFRG